MPEGFAVEPHYVSGYGNLMATERGNISQVRDHVELYTRLTDQYTGLLSLLKVPVEQYSDALWYRLGDRWENADNTARELHRVAWEYLDVDDENTTRFAGGVESEPDEDAESYPSSNPELPSLEVPEIVDYGEALEELSEVMFWINWFLTAYLGWSPLNELINKITGNWNALGVAGDALVIVGDGAEAVATSMAEGLTTLDEHWDGGAAQACVDYVTRMANALGEEGPLNRTVGKLYKLIADEAVEAIRQIIVDLKVPTDDVADRLGYVKICIFWVPTTTDESLDDAVKAMNYYKELFENAKRLVGQINVIVEQAQGFIESLQNMEDVSSLDGTIEELTGSIALWTEQAEADVATSLDLADLADTSEFANAPTDAYEAGDAERDGD